MAPRPPALEDESTRGSQAGDCADSPPLPPSPSLPPVTEEAGGLCWTRATLHLCVISPSPCQRSHPRAHGHADTHARTWGLGCPSCPLRVPSGCSRCAGHVRVHVCHLLPKARGGGQSGRDAGTFPLGTGRAGSAPRRWQRAGGLQQQQSGVPSAPQV